MTSRHFLPILLLWALLPVPLRAQLGLWETLAPMTTPRGDVAVCELDGKIYAAGGIGALSDPVRNFERYDVATNTWETLPIIPAVTGLYAAGLAAVEGRIYLFGGLKASFPVAAMETYIYDPASREWSDGPDMPKARGAMGVAVIGGKIYAAGGFTQSRGHDMAVFDPAGGWTELKPMPTSRDHLAGAAANGRFYAIGGRAVINPPLGIVEEYDPATDTWRQLASMPTPRGALGAATVSNTIFTFGGDGNAGDPSGLFDDVESFDPAAGELGLWAVRLPMQTPRHGIGVAAFNGKLHIPGGNTAAGFAATSFNDAFVAEVPPPTIAELVDHLLGRIARPAQADVNHDGTVDIADVLELAVQ